MNRFIYLEYLQSDETLTTVYRQKYPHLTESELNVFCCTNRKVSSMPNFTLE